MDPITIGLIVFGITALISGGTAAIINHKQKEETEDNMNKLQAAQTAANTKAANQAKVTERIKNALQQRTLSRTVVEATSAVTYQKILTDRTNREVAKKRADGDLVTNTVCITSRPEKEISGVSDVAVESKNTYSYGRLSKEV